MPNKMLIDASHPEETRVVVVRGNRIEEFDFESQDKKQLKGNIYLARVTRVEPSLQAAFIEYGGNRHGFLAFSEIHPDYYQIPVADRQALLRAEAEAAEEDDEDEEDERGRGRRRRGRGRHRGEARGASAGDSGDAGAAQAEAVDGEPGPQSAGDEGNDADEAGDRLPHDDESDGDADDRPAIAARADGDVVSEDVASSDENGGGVEEVNGHADAGEVESVGADDAVEEVEEVRQRARRFPRKQYKIQEVIKRRQILLVQVVKEERGNKGAALTTYLSLAGRYSVLMPNTARGGGISRKITNATDRKRLKDVVKDLDVPQGMGVILRTAGESRTKAEIKRDYEYLMRLWENVRTLTLQSTAPALVYEEGSLIKRSVRDLYNKDIEDIQVAGDEGYREAKDFMRMLMPSHAKVVQPYKEPVPLFVRYGVESQLDRMLQPQVTLKSGGYIIINQTEALVSIDVNSGRSTREHSIEDTALQTNLEAAEEVARQLRLRDLAGLIVIDFIDMEENRNNRAVEKKLKDCLKNDRARIQVGRISHFGLMEMSRQRIRASVLESTMQPCPHCGGTGHVRSDSSVALLVLRAIEEFLLKDSRYHLTVKTPFATALYVLNHKRRNLADLEAKFGLTITIEADDQVGAQHYAIFKGALVDRSVMQPAPVIEPPALDLDEDDDIVEIDVEESEEEAEAAAPSEQRQQREDGEHRRRRRRRRRRGGRDRDGAAGEQSAEADAPAVSDEAEDADDDEAPALADAEEAAAVEGEELQADDERAAKRRRRGKRGGRRNRAGDGVPGTDEADDAEAAVEEAEAGPDADRQAAPADAGEIAETAVAEIAAEAAAADAAVQEAAAADEVEPAKPARRSRKKAAEPAVAADAAEAPAKPARRSRKKAAPAAAEAPAAEAAPESSEPAAEAQEPVIETPVIETAVAPGASVEITTQAPSIETEAAAEPEPEPAGEAPAPAGPVVTSTAQSDSPRKGGWWQRKGFF